MNTTNLLNKTVRIAKEVKTVRSAAKGDVYAIWNAGETKYASFVASIQNITREENSRTYNLVLYYGDRMTQSGDNKEAIWDDAANTIQTVLNKINEDERCDVNSSYTIEFFEQKFSDYLAGAYVEVSIDVEDELGECEMNDMITDSDELTDKLKQAIREYEDKDAELTITLKQVLFKISGETVE